MSDEPHSYSSKDTIEHLRSVHFALILVSFILILIATSPTNSEVKNAENQLNQILEISHHWDDAALSRQMINQIAAALKMEPTKLAIRTDPPDANVIEISTIPAMLHGRPAPED